MHHDVPPDLSLLLHATAHGLGNALLTAQCEAELARARTGDSCAATALETCADEIGVIAGVIRQLSWALDDLLAGDPSSLEPVVRQCFPDDVDRLFAQRASAAA